MNRGLLNSDFELLAEHIRSNDTFNKVENRGLFLIPNRAGMTFSIDSDTIIERIEFLSIGRANH